MKLYHGTSEAVARAALTDGLLPREESGIESLWEECPSREDLVYLTVAYAGYFAAHAGGGGRWGIVEVDTDLLPEGEDLLVPDEDEGMAERTRWFRDRLGMFAHLWMKSVEGLGNCAHEGAIPPEAITRVTLFEPVDNHFVGMTALDPFISLMNYRFCGRKYRALTRWLAGHEVTATEVLDYMPQGLNLDADLTGLPEEMARLIQTFREQRDKVAKALAGHPGIEIVFPGFIEPSSS